MDRWSRRQLRGEPTAKPARVGYLSNIPVDGPSPSTDAFREGLRELGYQEGESVVVEYRSAGGQPGRLVDLATELLGFGVSVLVTSGTLATQTCSRVTDTVPIVMAASADP